MKKILLSSAVSMALAGSAMAASSINFGTADQTIHSTSSTSINIGDVNASAAASAIKYIPNIQLGEGNLISVNVSNAAVEKEDGNVLYLVDLNATEGNDTDPYVVARMVDYVGNTAGNYTKMTFKFDVDTDSKHELVIVNKLAESNATGRFAGFDAGVMNVVTSDGLSCGDKIQVSVTDSTDQSARALEQANAPANGNSVTAIKPVYVKDCDVSTSCNISYANGELNFGSTTTTTADATQDCPTCTATDADTVDCAVTVELGVKGADYNATNIYTQYGMASSTDFTAVNSMRVDTDNNGDGTFEDTESATPSATDTAVAVIEDNYDVMATGRDFNSTITLTVDGDTVIDPRTFDLEIKAGGTPTANDITVDTLSQVMKFVEPGTPLTVSYLSANPDYRSIVRVTSSSAGMIEAVITTEDGVTSDRFDTGATIGANGGAVVVIGKDLLSKAQDAGFAGTGMRFNATLYVKTNGTVDAVAYQTAGTSGSQRYLPVGGASGGAK